MGVRRWKRAAIVLGVLAVPFACRKPTQMTVEVRMFGDLPCSDVRSIAIITKQDRQSAELALRTESYTTELFDPVCDGSGLVGTLVITPDQNTGAIVVAARVVGTGRCAYVPDDPEHSYLGCIIARRAFDFIEHVSLTLPISLEGACLDVPCDVGSSCRAKQCVDETVRCDPDGNCSSEAEPQRLEDGGSMPPPEDAIVRPKDGGASDAASDANGDGATDAGGDAGDGGGGDGGSDSGGRGPGTNLCPVKPTAIDCFDTAQICCDGNARVFTCGLEGPCGAPGTFAYRCTGRAHCASDQFCCASNVTAPVMPRSACASCTLLTATILCSTDDDCPVGAFCTVQYTPNDNTTFGAPLKACSAQ